MDYQSNPLGIDITNPHFSWQMKASGNKRGYQQKAYQIVVSDAKNQVVWDSKKINSDISHGIEYTGSSLQATTRYVWKITVWDNLKGIVTNSSWFETGLLNTSISAWDDAGQRLAKWIGGSNDDLVLYSHYLSVFKFEYSIQLDKNANTTKAAFVFGGNDKRLMKKDLNLMNVQSGQNQSYITFELDITNVSEAPDGLAKLNIYRVGYDKNDKTLTAQSVEEVRPKVFVYDMGQNMVGVPQIKIKNGKKWQEITLRYAEVKYPNLPDYKGNEGMVMMENIRAALTQDSYILKGGDETIQPRFTFHGYRYVEITGIGEAIAVNDVKGLVISSINELSSTYETSNDLVNKLWNNITWSLRSNFLSIPTDTPARNERMGWSGDISVFLRSATYLTNADLFLRRHLLGMRDVQFDDGRFTDVAPMGGGFGGTLWGSAGIVVAWETFQ